MLGYYGPFLLFLTSIILFLLYKPFSFSILYIVFSIFNTIINILLKIGIQQPRPSLKNCDKWWFNIYGMPSGHAQSVFFSGVLLMYYFPLTWIYLLVLSLWIATLYQRYSSLCHSAFQLLIGSLVGILIAYLFINFSPSLLSNQI